MKFKNPNKNNELTALIEVLNEKGIITINEIKEKKEKKANGKHN